MDERDHLYRADQRVWQIPAPTPAQYSAAERYLQRTAPDLLEVMGFAS